MLIAKTLLCVLIFLARETPMLSNYLSKAWKRHSHVCLTLPLISNLRLYQNPSTGRGLRATWLSVENSLWMVSLKHFTSISYILGSVSCQ